MFIGQKLIYLEMSKTGSTKIRSTLADVIPGITLGKHNPLESSPGPFYVCGSVRNPWAWYVSLWAYGCTGRGALQEYLTSPYFHISHPRRLLTALRHRGWEWPGLYTDPSDQAAFRSWLAKLLDPDWLALWHPSLQSGTIGLMSFRFLTLYTDSYSSKPTLFTSQDEVAEYFSRHTILHGLIRTENMGDGIVAVLREAGYDVSEEDIRRIHAKDDQRINTSVHGDVAAYYDAGSRELVRRRERFISERFGYRAP